MTGSFPLQVWIEVEIVTGEVFYVLDIELDCELTGSFAMNETLPQRVLVFRSDEPEQHVLQIVRRTEGESVDYSGPMVLKDVVLINGDFLNLKDRNCKFAEKKLIFLGDSITAGATGAMEDVFFNDRPPGLCF
jgi:hypothetical protein